MHKCIKTMRQYNLQVTIQIQFSSGQTQYPKHETVSLKDLTLHEILQLKRKTRYSYISVHVYCHSFSSSAATFKKTQNASDLYRIFFVKLLNDPFPWNYFAGHSALGNLTHHSKGFFCGFVKIFKLLKAPVWSF